MALSIEAAEKKLGRELASMLRGLIADMREAVYLGELPGTVNLVEREGRLLLSLPLSEDAALEIMPIGLELDKFANCSRVHRVKLLRVIRDGVAAI